MIRKICILLTTFYKNYSFPQMASSHNCDIPLNDEQLHLLYFAIVVPVTLELANKSKILITLRNYA